MDKSKKHIYNEHNGLYYTLIADYLSGLSNLPYAPIPLNHGNGDFLLIGVDIGLRF